MIENYNFSKFYLLFNFQRSEILVSFDVLNGDLSTYLICEIWFFEFTSYLICTYRNFNSNNKEKRFLKFNKIILFSSFNIQDPQKILIITIERKRTLKWFIETSFLINIESKNKK